MATRLINKPILSAALGIAVVVFGLGVAGATSVATTSAVPLAEIKLVSETSDPSSEVAAASKNGNHGGALRIVRRIFTHSWDASSKAGDLVAVDIR